MLAPQRYFPFSLQNHGIGPNEVVANPAVEIRMGVTGIVPTICRHDNISLALAAVIKLQAVLRKLIICRELAFQLAVDLKTTDDILFDRFTHASAYHEYFPA
ncbi:hypothetical protein [Burkholderia gladioli]|uniref:hypothetical protein n=1 Tax=Burkholderia gladioli TaxID=28095 RepID=UPI00163E1C9E|nr:hypothetical protein [Burkholderia gladioli]